MLKYEKMSLFDAPPGAILMHGCNAQGVWGRGGMGSSSIVHPIYTHRFFR